MMPRRVRPRIAERIAVESSRCLLGVDADGLDEPVGERAEEDLVQAALDEEGR